MQIEGGLLHGVTRPEAVRDFDPRLASACATAMEQTPLLQGFDRLAANSMYNATGLLAAFGSATRWSLSDIRVIGPRIYARGEARVADIPASQPGMRLLAVGRIKSHKKLEHVLSLFAEVLKINSAADLTIVGGGDDRAYREHLMRAQRDDLRLPEDTVRWLGSVDQATLDAEYRRATVYVSMSEDEGFCLPLLEAMMRGVPVVAYGTPAVRETLDGAGISFAEKDFEALARRMTGLLSSEPSRRDLIEGGRRRAGVLISAMDGSGFLSLVFP